MSLIAEQYLVNSQSHALCVRYLIPQNIIVIESILNNKMWLVFMYVNMEKKEGHESDHTKFNTGYHKRDVQFCTWLLPPAYNE